MAGPRIVPRPLPLLLLPLLPLLPCGRRLGRGDGPGL